MNEQTRSQQDLSDEIKSLKHELQAIKEERKRWLEVEASFRKTLYELADHQEHLRLLNRELKETKDELESAKNRYKELYDFSPLGYVSLCREGLIKEINLTGSKMVGISRALLLDQPFLEFIHDNYRELFMKFIEEVTNSGRGEAELEIIGSNGRLFYAALEGVRPQDSSEEGRMSLVALKDITELKRNEVELEKAYDEMEQRVRKRTQQLHDLNVYLEHEIQVRKRAEAELTDREERLRQLTENIKEIFWLLDPATRKVLYVSPAYEDISGRPSQDMYVDPTSLLRFVHEEDQAEFLRWLDFDLNTKEIDFEFRLMRPDGSIRWIHVRAFPVLDANDEMYRVAGVAEDITERRIFEQELQQKNELLQTVFDNIPVMIRLYDHGNKTIFINPEYEKTLGWSAQEIKDMDILKACYPTSELRENVLDHLKHGIGWKDFVTTSRSGRLVHTSWANVRLSDNTFIGIGIDITQRKTIEEQNFLYQEQLRSLAAKLSSAQEREKRRIAVDLHDRVTQALTLAKMKLAKLRKANDFDEPILNMINEVVDLIDTSVGDTRSLILDLRPPVLYEMGLEEALYELIEEIEEEHGIRGSLIRGEDTLDLDEDLRSTIYRAVREFLINIVKHSETEDYSVSLSVEDQCIHAVVQDNGNGFDPSALANPNNPKKPSFGLFSVQEEVGFLGGAVSVESEPGAGTRASVIVPLPS